MHVTTQAKLKSSPVKQGRDWLQQTKDISPLLVVAVGAVYVIGLITANVHMMHMFGTTALLPLVRLRYLIVGFTSLLFAAAGPALVLGIAFLRNLCKELPVCARDKHYRLLLNTVASMLPVLCLGLIYKYYSVYGHYSGKLLDLLIWPFGLSVPVSLVRNSLHNKESQIARTESKLASFFACIFILAVTLIVYPLKIYPFLSQSIGGGEPVAVRLFFAEPNDKLTKFLQAEDPEHAGISFPLLMVDSTDDHYLLVVPDSKLVYQRKTRWLAVTDLNQIGLFPLLCIRKDKVSAIFYFPRAKHGHPRVDIVSMHG